MVISVKKTIYIYGGLRKAQREERSSEAIVFCVWHTVSVSEKPFQGFIVYTVGILGMVMLVLMVFIEGRVVYS